MIRQLRAHPIAVNAVMVAVLLYLACGLLFAHTEQVFWGKGLYCAAANAMTEGDCNVNPTTWIAYVVNTIEHVGLVAISGAALAVFTSKVSAVLVKRHLDNSERRMKLHFEAKLEERLRHHLGKPSENGNRPATEVVGSVTEEA